MYFWLSLLWDMVLNRTIFLLVALFITSCAFIQAGDIKVVKVEPDECEFKGFLSHAFTDDRESGINLLKRDTVRSGGNTLYLPPKRQAVLGGSLNLEYLSIGSSYLCPVPH